MDIAIASAEHIGRDHVATHRIVLANRLAAIVIVNLPAP
jgi:hypothetical protein